ncbi:PLP-dependent aspartate aminotransferase family protein [Chitinophagaceae bacterium LB-8]|uniref:PLP-dependent aspartate aminotransferase family protein n=1 Tax=Paraflavisolibacter caeni TaxID=2982496 RepID=A0A9X2XU54_9BACT|nr:PLP-dependent aspartate aminotransferase family protein [Paraflavisolibacter caeni]MCU7548402.1 PLP-dependent aspartate aminotransferase family protein [Paraflavisolibacter caeni]
MADHPFIFSGFGSAAVHGGHEEDPRHAHVTPIYATSTFRFDTAEQGMRRFTGEEPGYIYSRWGNPTFTEAENKIAVLEAFGLNLHVKGLLHASGMAAITTLMLSNLKAGDKILTHYSLYGGTEELVLKVLSQIGIEAIISDLRDLETAEHILKQDKGIKLMYLETPANPTIRCVDIEALTTLAKKYGIKVACDNTFATPYLQQPFRYGVDFVIHSTTKFLNGHGNMIGGILLGRDIDFMKAKVTKTQQLLGGNANPFDAFLLNNGLKTLELRMERHCSNAMTVAEYLAQHPKVSGVNYTGLSSHPDYALAQKQMRLGGGMLSFELKDGFNAGVRFMNRLQMCVRTVSLGTCDTLLCHAASMTHYGIPKEQREQYGITDGLIRMNVGIENSVDIIADLEEALG